MIEDGKKYDAMIKACNLTKEELIETGQIKVFEIPDNDNFLCNDKIYLIPIEPSNKPIRVFIEGE